MPSISYLTAVRQMVPHSWSINFIQLDRHFRINGLPPGHALGIHFTGINGPRIMMPRSLDWTDQGSHGIITQQSCRDACLLTYQLAEDTLLVNQLPNPSGWIQPVAQCLTDRGPPGVTAPRSKQQSLKLKAGGSWQPRQAQTHFTSATAGWPICSGTSAGCFAHGGT